MHQINFSVNGSLADAANALAERSVELRMQKQALSGADIAATIKGNPALSHGLVGGAIGAGAGGLGALFGNIGKDQDERKGILSSALTGGLAGAGIGAGVGAARSGFGALGTPHNDVVTPGTFPAGAKTMKISPEALKQNPDLVKQVQELSTPSVPERALGAAWEGVKSVNRTVPWSTKLLPTMGAADLAMNSNRLNLGDKTVPFTGKKIHFPGRIDPRNSTQVKHMDRGVELASDGKFSGLSEGEKSVLSMLRHDDAGRADIEAMAKTRTPVTRPVEQITELPQAPRRETTKTRDSGGRVTGTQEVIIPQSPRKISHQIPTTIPSGLEHNLAQMGAENNFDRLGKNKGWYSSAPSTPQIHRGLTGERDLTSKIMHPFSPRLIARLGLYGAIPAAEYVGKTVWNANNEQQSMSEMIEKLRQKGLIKESE